MIEEMESWEPIHVDGYEGLYEISSYGRVRSLPREFVREIKGRRTAVVKREGKMLKISSYPSNPYEYVLLSNKEPGQKRIQKCLYIHKLVAQTFIPNPDNRKTVTHRNGNKRDNRVENLKWK